MKKLILILGIIGISVTSFAATRRNSRVVYVKREPRRRVIRRRYIFIRVPRRKKVVYVKREPSRRQRRVRIAAGRRRAARRR
jgi:putative basic membrane protein